MVPDIHSLRKVRAQIKADVREEGRKGSRRFGGACLDGPRYLESLFFIHEANHHFEKVLSSEIPIK